MPDTDRSQSFEMTRRGLVRSSLLGVAAVAGSTSAGFAQPAPAASVPDYQVKVGQIQVKAGIVDINNSKLATGLVQQPNEALKQLGREGVPISPSEISIGDHGNVIIDNARYASALASSINPIAADTNYACGNNYKCKPK